MEIETLLQILLKTYNLSWFSFLAAFLFKFPKTIFYLTSEKVNEQLLSPERNSAI